MERFLKETVSAHVDRIKTPFGVCMYFVKGKEKGLLIDTGMGVGDLKAFVDAQETVPYDVALTHGHCDHAGGSVQFENVWMNPKDVELEKVHACLQHRIFDVFHAPWGVPEGVSEADFVPQRTEGYRELNESAAFDLGGVHVRWIEVSGHTQGCMVPIIEEDRIAVIGDALGENTLLHMPESTSVETYRASLMHLNAYESMFDTCLRFHGSCVSEKKIIADTITLCTDVMAGRDAKIRTEMMGYTGCLAREKSHPGYAGNFIYNPDRIQEVKP
ncbi:MAG: MBL fold metallo-hydrolase [Bulleidia sp.]